MANIVSTWDFFGSGRSGDVLRTEEVGRLRSSSVAMRADVRACSAWTRERTWERRVCRESVDCCAAVMWIRRRRGEREEEEEREEKRNTFYIRKFSMINCRKKQIKIGIASRRQL